MKIDVARLEENREDHFKESLSPRDLDLDTNEVKYNGEINIATAAKKEMGLIFTKTHFAAEAEFICSRCLKKYTRKIDKNFDIKYPLDKLEQSIDITKDIREEVILDYPVKFLCRVNCLGLCSKCGKDLNEGKCSCEIS